MSDISVIKTPFGDEYEIKDSVARLEIIQNSDVTEVSDTTPYLYKTSEHDAVYDELVGGSVAWNQLAKPISSWGYAGIDVSTSSDGVMTINGTATGNTYPKLNDVEKSIVGHKYIVTLNRTDLQSGIVLMNDSNNGISIANGIAVQNATGAAPWYIKISSGTVCNNVKVTPQIIDLTQMFGSTIADYAYSLEQSTAGSGIAWLKSYGFFTEDYYAYNAGTLMSVNVSGKKVVGKNLVEETIVHSNVTASGSIQATENTSFDVHICKVQKDQQYFLTTGNTGGEGFVYSFFLNEPTRGTASYNGVRYVTAPTPITAPITGYMAFRTAASYATPQCELGSTATNYEPYTSLTYPIQSTDLRGLYKLSGTKLYTDGDIYSADGQITRKYGYRDYQSGDESLANAITDGTHTIYKLSAPTTVTALPFTSPQIVYRSGTEEYLDTRDVPMPVGGNRKYIDIPEWMVNEYFDDVRGKTLSTTGGTMTGDIIFDMRDAGAYIRTSNDSSGVGLWNSRAEIYAGDNTKNAELVVRKNGGIELSAYDGTNSAYSALEVATEGVYYNDEEVATNPMTGYSKPTEYSAITSSDTIKSAIGKLEAGLGDGGGAQISVSGTTLVIET